MQPGKHLVLLPIVIMTFACAGAQTPESKPAGNSVFVIPRVPEKSESDSERDLTLYFDFMEGYVKLKPAIETYLNLTDRHREFTEGVKLLEGYEEQLGDPQCEAKRFELVLTILDAQMQNIQSLVCSTNAGVRILESLSGKRVDETQIPELLEIYIRSLNALSRSLIVVKQKRLEIEHCIHPVTP